MLRIEWNMAGFEDILTAQDTADVLNEVAGEIAARANSFGRGNFEVLPATVRQGRKRADRMRAAVRTGDLEAIKAEAEDHVLLKAAGGESRVKYTSRSGRVSYITQAQYENYTRKKKP